VPYTLRVLIPIILSQRKAEEDLAGTGNGHGLKAKKMRPQSTRACILEEERNVKIEESGTEEVEMVETNIKEIKSDDGGPEDEGTYILGPNAN